MDTRDDGTVAWREMLHEARDRLAAADVPNPETEARWLVEEASGHEGADYLPGLDRLCTVGGVARFDAMLGRRLEGEPIQYVLGHWSFRSLDLLVDGRVLIPRPETEELVSVALDELNRVRESLTEPRTLIAVDLGCGSGAIALSIASETDDVQVVAVERSADAMAVARANLAGLGTPAARVQLVEGSWFEPLVGNEGRFDLIVSNPPYVAAGDELPPSVRDHEPVEALLAGDDGLDDARVLIDGSLDFLAPGGSLVLELGSAHLPVAVNLAKAAGHTEVEMLDDLAGRRRILRTRKP